MALRKIGISASRAAPQSIDWLDLSTREARRDPFPVERPSIRPAADAPHAHSHHHGNSHPRIGHRRHNCGLFTHLCRDAQVPAGRKIQAPSIASAPARSAATPAILRASGEYSPTTSISGCGALPRPSSIRSPPFRRNPTSSASDMVLIRRRPRRSSVPTSAATTFRRSAFGPSWDACSPLQTTPATQPGHRAQLQQLAAGFRQQPLHHRIDDHRREHALHRRRRHTAGLLR